MPDEEMKRIPGTVILRPAGPDDEGPLIPIIPPGVAARRRWEEENKSSTHMAPPSDWEYEWPLLSVARDRLDPTIDSITARAIAAATIDGPLLRAGVFEPAEAALAVEAFRSIICRGEVPVLAVRPDCGSRTPELVEALLAAAKHAIPYVPISEIDASFDRCVDRAIFGPRSDLSDATRYPPTNDLQLRLFDVRVHWPTLVNKLKAIGVLAGTLPNSGVAQVEPGPSHRTEAINNWPAVGGGSDQLTSAKSGTCDEEPLSSTEADPRQGEGEPNIRSPRKLPLPGQERVAVIDAWANNKWGPDFSELPGRTVLQQLLRDDFPDSHVNRADVAELRRTRATKESRDGGAPTHARNRKPR
jgi:hypothetical protein